MANEPSEPHGEVAILRLFKFGKLEHMESLLARGLLHLKRLDYFSKLEESEIGGRADRWEGVHDVLQPHRIVKFKVGEKELSPSLLKGPVLLQRVGRPVPHVYCVYALTEPEMLRCHESGQQPVHPRSAELDGHVVIIREVSEFIERVDRAIEDRGLDLNRGLVIYVPETHHGELGPFRKRDAWAHQSEARYVVGGHDGETLEIEIGSLEEIAELRPARDVLNIEYVAEPETQDPV